MWINSPYTCGLFSRLSFLLHWSVSVFTPVLYYSDYCSFVIQGSWCHQLYCSFSRLLWLFLVFHGSIHGEMRLLGEPDLEPLTLVQSSGLSFRALAEAGQTVWNKTWTPCCALIPQPSLEISLKVVWNVAKREGQGKYSSEEGTEMQEWCMEKTWSRWKNRGDPTEWIGRVGRSARNRISGLNSIAQSPTCDIQWNPPSLKLTLVWATLTSVCPAKWVVESCVKFPSVYQHIFVKLLLFF